LAVVFAAWQADLRTEQALPTAVRIAVLPFHVASVDEADQIMATRLTERVTAELVRIGSLDVVASTSALQFKEDRGLLRDVAKALRADMLMEGRLIEEGDNIRVQARISAGAVDQKFWVDDSFVGSDLDELAKRIAVSATNTILARQRQR
jgi:TolB-like protein